VLDIDKRKYLVPHDFTMGQFLYIIRKRIKMEPYEALFVYIDNKLVPTAHLIIKIEMDFYMLVMGWRILWLINMIR